jgi:iron(III) transport system ATP-binding protein
MWTLRNITLQGSNSRARLRIGELQIDRGVTAVLGWSGAGKTSLLNLLAGFEQLPGGEITRPPRVAWAPQSNGLWAQSTVMEHLTLCGAREGRAKEILETFELLPLAAQRPATLSEGEAARLAIARAIAADAPALVLDEPLAHVDMARVGSFWNVIREHAVGRTLVFSSHQPAQVLAEASRVICLAEGDVVFHGAVGDLYDSPPTERLMNFLGPGNWMEPGNPWLPVGVVRPERLSITPAEVGPLVMSSKFCGVFTETTLRAESGESRMFFHRPPRALAVGARVALRILSVIIAVVLAACGKSGEVPVIPVKSWRAWMLPPEGSVQPTPRSMTSGPNDELAVLDTSGRVLIYDAGGVLLRQWKMLDVQFGKPEGIVWLRDNSLVVCDTHYHRLVWFEQNGGLIKTVGKRGEGDGEFLFPVGIAKDPAENLYVCEYGGGDRIQVFTKDGKFIRAFGSAGTGPGQFQRPSGLAWHGGRVYIADAVNNRVHVYEDDGKYVGLLGSLPLNLPYDIAMASDGAFYIIEYGAGRLSKVSKSGELLGQYGSSGTGEGNFATPWGLTVDGKMRVHVADTKNRRIVTLGL